MKRIFLNYVIVVARVLSRLCRISKNCASNIAEIAGVLDAKYWENHEEMQTHSSKPVHEEVSRSLNEGTFIQ